MIPRGVLDIGWRDLFAALGGCVDLLPVAELQQQVEEHWSPGETVACLSVRSGFDALLQSLDWPAGSEILVSAITIPDMLRIIAARGYVAVPLDVNRDTLGIDPADIVRRSNARTRGVLVAHLFGSRMPLDAVVQVAQQRQLLVFEDCAQAFDGGSYRGDPGAAASLFSFGPIKTQTALGGGLVRISDPGLRRRVRELQATYPHQSRWSFLRRVLLFSLFKLLSGRLWFTACVQLCQVLGCDYDAALKQQLRGFSPQPLQPQLRRQPSAPLLKLLLRRLQSGPSQWLRQRQQIARDVADHLGVILPGHAAVAHAHWVLPFEASDAQGLGPKQLAHLLAQHGFDATCKASNLIVVPPPIDQPDLDPQMARRLMEHVLYLPLHPALSRKEQARLCSLLPAYFDSHHSTKQQDAVSVTSF